MVNKCVAPKCKSGYDKTAKEKEQPAEYIHLYSFPKEKELFERWRNAVPRKGWKPSKNSVLCEKHFLPSDFKEQRADSNATRKRKKGNALHRRELKVGTTPSQWPGCPVLLSKPPTLQRLSNASSSSREQNIIIQEELKADKERKRDTFTSLNELDKKLEIERLPPDVIVYKSENTRIILSVCHEAKPGINFCLKLNNLLQFEMWCKGEIVAKKYVSDPEIASSPPKLNSCKLIITILHYLQKQFIGIVTENKTERDQINEIVVKLQDLCENQKIAFLAEQLSLVYCKPNARRYSSSLLAMAFMWQSVSPTLYKQISLDGILTLPSAKYVRNLVSAVGEDLKLTEPAEKYLKSRFSKLNQDDQKVSLLMDEVYCKQTVQYANGQFYGKENNEVTKTLLCVMVKSICGKYRDIVSMTPITNINADKLYTVWKSCITVLSDIGFVVVVTMTDGHNSNEKLFKKLRGKDKEQFFIEHPCIPGNKIFLLFDPVHLFKNFYNNFRMYDIFQYPKFQMDVSLEGEMSETSLANFAHIRQLYDLELGKPIKMAHKLNDKVLNPSQLEKTSVKLADSVYHESTINALNYYSNHGYPDFKGTAEFLRIIRNWFNTMNIKSSYQAQKTRDKHREPVNNETRNEITSYLVRFHLWLIKWLEDPNQRGLSQPTFRAAAQTTGSFPQLLNYLLDEMFLEFVLTGHISSDFIESRFGWYRQLLGANYYNSVLQFLQAEKTIRIRSLVKMGFNLSDVKEIFETDSQVKSAEVDHEISLVFETVESFKFEELGATEDQAIVYAISGYIARNLIRSMSRSDVSKCDDCSEFLSPGKVPLQLEIDQVEDTSTSVDQDAKEEFVRSITRGGLIKPSDALFILCAHVYMMYTFIMNEDQRKKVLLSTSHPRSVFVGAFLQKLEDHDNTSVLLDSKCIAGHQMKPFIKRAVFTMFNIFSKNLVGEENSKIHTKRKRAAISDAKKSSTARKLKKLSSK